MRVHNGFLVEPTFGSQLDLLWIKGTLMKCMCIVPDPDP
jgi:hypothetical protein